MTLPPIEVSLTFACICCAVAAFNLMIATNRLRRIEADLFRALIVAQNLVPAPMRQPTDLNNSLATNNLSRDETDSAFEIVEGRSG